jgi:hypothetical protein
VAGSVDKQTASAGNKFKNASGRHLLKELFFETALDKANVVYTLKDQDHLGYPSLYRLYMEANDPTEYRFATQHLDGLRHWKALQKCTWFVPFIEAWREELDIRSKSEAVSRIRQVALSGGKDSLTANKYLAEKGWEKAPTNTKGRPTKDQVNKAAAQIAEDSQRVAEDLLRLTNPQELN